MNKIFVQDYDIQNYLDCGIKDFCLVVIYYAHDKNNEMESSEYFSIHAGTPDGIAGFLSYAMANKFMKSIDISSSFIVLEQYDDGRIIDFVKNEIESFSGETVEELLLRILQKFNWEYSNDMEVMNSLFKNLSAK
ncbi:Imm8 family immunity protein [Chitinophaga sp. Cy-1792]|uniref:Imm8 family immunity protein n=1 Tax=Chitinophaga sp. Cy-1792 TaxID=2608339 RepID=UPI00141E4BF4|nr:Imm8 family immunity protein [Chitinophaga sp. Cy-1792]NIG54875.1 hypothetical protein [Chitinophaga sp. Cy-1792]